MKSPLQPDLPAASKTLLRWQMMTAITLFVGYVGYYICRVNLAVSTPLLLEEFGPTGTGQIDKEAIGWIASMGVTLYAIGKITNGMSADFLGGRGLFLGGMFASVACTVAFGFSTGLTVFVVIWAANRYFQSMGWVSLVKIASRWYPVHRHATIMGVLSMSYLIGDALGKAYLGAFVYWGQNSDWIEITWRHVFSISAGTLAAIAVLCSLFLKSCPAQVGAKEPRANSANVYGAEGQEAGAHSPLRLIWPLLGSASFWLMSILNFGLTFIRETFNFWTPTYLYEVGELKAGEAAVSSMLFPLVGAVSALIAGALSDKWEGKHGRVAVPSLLLLIASLVLLGVVPAQGKPVVAVVMVCSVSFFLIAPYSFLSGVIALDLGGKKGAATVSGLIDSAGYTGGILSGSLVAIIATKVSWNAVFLLLAAVAGLTTLAAVAYWVRQERSDHQRSDGARQ